MASTPNVLGTPRAQVAAISTANTNRDGTGTIVDIFNPGASGSAVHRIMVKATGTTTAGMVRLFIHNGTSWFLLEELLIGAVTPSGTVRGWETEIVYGEGRPMIVPSGYKLGAAPHNANTFNVVALGGDF